MKIIYGVGGYFLVVIHTCLYYFLLSLYRTRVFMHVLVLHNYLLRAAVGRCSQLLVMLWFRSCCILFASISLWRFLVSLKADRRFLSGIEWLFPIVKLRATLRRTRDSSTKSVQFVRLFNLSSLEFTKLFSVLWCKRKQSMTHFRCDGAVIVVTFWPGDTLLFWNERVCCTAISGLAIFAELLVACCSHDTIRSCVWWTSDCGTRFVSFEMDGNIMFR